MMRRLLAEWALCGVLMISGQALSNGLLVPVDRSMGGLPIASQRVDVTIRDQAAVTRVEQEFRNPTSRPIEAEYLFALPPGAGVTDFSMWVDGKQIKAELIESAKARQIYEDIVRRLKDPALLENIGDDLWKVRVFPIPPGQTRKIELSYSQVAKKDGSLAEYVFPLRGAGASARVERDFSLRLQLESGPAIKSVYSPTHPVSVQRSDDHKAVVGLETRAAALDRDFQLFWTTSNEDVGLSLVAHRESPGDAGYFLMLLSPSVDTPNHPRPARDLVFVLDTSGSMTGEKFTQAKKALEHCVSNLGPEDRFGLVAFSTTSQRYAETLKPGSRDEIARAKEWIGRLSAVGGTAIDDALSSALALRTSDARDFTIVFLTDGLPTVGVTDPAKILANVESKNASRTRIFSFGVGDDVSVRLLDQLAERTRAASAYVRPSEDIEAKVSSFFGKISRPALSELELSVGAPGIHLAEMFPPKLPDLFHGSQLTLMGRYTGEGPTTIRLTGKVGGETKTIVYDTMLPAEKRENAFVSGLWARRKVGYLLDQIRLTGENKELVDEVVTLAKRHGIATPYTSFLATPDEPPSSRPVLRRMQIFQGNLDGREDDRLGRMPRMFGEANQRPAAARQGTEEFRRERAKLGLASTPLSKSPRGALSADSGASAVDMAEALRDLKQAEGHSATATRNIAGRTFVLSDGVWVDDKVTPTAKRVAIEYLSDAYFKILQKVPDAKNIFALGERICWLTPSGVVLVVDGSGKTLLDEKEIGSMFPN